MISFDCIYLREHDCSVTVQAKYGAVFHRLHSKDVDNLYVWMKMLWCHRAGDFNKDKKVGHWCTTTTIVHNIVPFSIVNLFIYFCFFIQVQGPLVLQPTLNTSSPLAPPPVSFSRDWSPWNLLRWLSLTIIFPTASIDAIIYGHFQWQGKITVCSFGDLHSKNHFCFQLTLNNVS